MCKDKQVRFMTNLSHKGKYPKSLPFSTYQKEFEQVETHVLDMYRLLTGGFAVAPYCDKWRHSDNFIEAWHIGLDFDTEDVNSTIEWLKAEPFIAKFGAFIYTTPSHTADKPRCRVIFILDQPIKTAKAYKKAVTALQFFFPHADKSAKDAARLFYGSPNCETVELWQVLPLSVLRDVYQMVKGKGERDTAERKAKRQAQTATAATGNGYAAWTTADYDYVLDRIAAQGKPAYNTRHALLVMCASAWGIEQGAAMVADAFSHHSQHSTAELTAELKRSAQAHLNTTGGDIEPQRALFTTWRKLDAHASGRDLPSVGGN